MAQAERMSEEEIVAIREARFSRVHSHLADVPADMKIISAEVPTTTSALHAQADALEAAVRQGMDHVPGYYCPSPRGGLSVRAPR